MIGADGSLTGFGGGLDWKRWLLAPRAAAGLAARRLSATACGVGQTPPRDARAGRPRDGARPGRRCGSCSSCTRTTSRSATAPTSATTARTGTAHLDAYWHEPDRHPFLFRVDGRLAGLRARAHRARRTTWPSSSCCASTGAAASAPTRPARSSPGSPGRGRPASSSRTPARSRSGAGPIPVAFDEAPTDEGPVQRFVMPGPRSTPRPLCARATPIRRVARQGALRGAAGRRRRPCDDAAWPTIRSRRATERTAEHLEPRFVFPERRRRPTPSSPPCGKRPNVAADRLRRRRLGRLRLLRRRRRGRRADAEHRPARARGPLLTSLLLGAVVHADRARRS